MFLQCQTLGKGRMKVSWKGRETMASELIRDFIYLDIERVRSFVAQAYGGLTSERTIQGEHQMGGQGGGKGKLPFIAEASGTVDYHYLKSHSETKSLHDHIFEELLTK